MTKHTLIFFFLLPVTWSITRCKNYHPTNPNSIMKTHFILLLITLPLLSSVSGCAQYFPSDPTSKVRVFKPKIDPLVKESPFYVAAKFKAIYTSDIPTEDKKLSFEEAFKYDETLGFGKVETNFFDINDKALRYNPAFHHRWYEQAVHTYDTYAGGDFWGREFSADLTTRAEYYLIRAARHLLAKRENGVSNVYNHHLHKGPVASHRGRPPMNKNSMGMNAAMMWLADLGFDDEKIDKYAFHCFALAYSEMKKEDRTNEKEWITHNLASVVNRYSTRQRYGKEVVEKHKTTASFIEGLIFGNWPSKYFTGKYGEAKKQNYIKTIMDLNIYDRQQRCPAVKDTMKINGKQLFYKDVPKELNNHIIETIYVDDPRFDPRFFQSLFSKENYYGELTRVAANGSFASLRKADGRSFMMSYNPRETGLPSGLQNKDKNRLSKIGKDSRLQMGTLFKSWVNDRSYIQRFHNTDLSIAFAKTHGTSITGSVQCRPNLNEFSFQLGASLIRRAYDCSMRYSMDKANKAFVRMLKGPGTDGALFATFDVEDDYFGGEHYAVNRRNQFANEELFKANKPVLVADYIEKQVLNKAPLNTAISYIQRLENGKVEGVVHVLGYKIIFDMTDISNWYRDEMSDVYPANKPLIKWRDIHSAALSNAQEEFRLGEIQPLLINPIN